MKFAIRVNDRDRIVDLEVDGNRVRGRIDGQVIEADAVEVSPGTYSLLIDGCAFEVRIEPTATGPRVLLEGREYAMTILDPRQWRRQGGSALEAEGRQKVISPMPGKIVSVLVKSGDRVEAGQGLLVVEAMKMQNEVRSPKSGTVERLLVSEGQAVTAGETLGFIA
jgi:biotin carboxyl carrier protein